MKFLIFIITFFSITSTAQNTDINILKNINLNRNKNLDNTFKRISNTVAPASIALPLLVFSYGLLKQDTTYKNKGIFIGSALVITAVITAGLKYAVNRTRPFETFSFIDNVVDEKTASFPSGHTSFAFSTATSFSLAFPKWYVIAPSFIWASTVAYSRMDLGVHYPSDVLVGAIIGAATSYLCIKANNCINKREKIKDKI